MGARIGAILALVLTATPAVAAGVIPIDGAYGNAAGCHLYETGERQGSDYLLLTPDSFSSAGTACDFETLVASDFDGFTIGASCTSNGTAVAGQESLRVLDHGPAGYGVKFGDLAEWGPLQSCPADDGANQSEVQL